MIHVLAFLVCVWICFAQPRVAALAGALFLFWLWAGSTPPPGYEIGNWAIFVADFALFAFAFYPRRKRV